MGGALVGGSSGGRARVYVLRGLHDRPSLARPRKHIREQEPNPATAQPNRLRERASLAQTVNGRSRETEAIDQVVDAENAIVSE